MPPDPLEGPSKIFWAYLETQKSNIRLMPLYLTALNKLFNHAEDFW